MKKKSLIIWLCLALVMGSMVAFDPIDVRAHDGYHITEEDPIMRDVVPEKTAATTFRSDHLYGVDPTVNGVASIRLLNVPAGHTLSQDNGETTLAVISISNQTVLADSDIYIRDNVLYFAMQTKGSVTVRLAVNGKEFEFNLTCYRPTMTLSHLMRLKQKKTLKVKGVPSGTRIKYSSTKKRIVSVSASGVVRAKKKGNAIIYAKIGSIRIGTVISVTTAKKVRAIKRASKMADSSKYSQPKRMLKGYYDCSSLVWRAYKPEGYRFGVRFWAPTAAEEARYLVRRKKFVCKLKRSNLQKMRYQAGDLLFITGAKNNRYRGIYHVEMFRGYRLEGWTRTGKPVLVSRWANFDDGYADYRTDGIVCRP